MSCFVEPHSSQAILATPVSVQEKNSVSKNGIIGDSPKSKELDHLAINQSAAETAGVRRADLLCPSPTAPCHM